MASTNSARRRAAAWLLGLGVVGQSLAARAEPTRSFPLPDPAPSAPAAAPPDAQPGSSPVSVYPAPAASPPAAASPAYVHAHSYPQGSYPAPFYPHGSAPAPSYPPNAGYGYGYPQQSAPRDQPGAVSPRSEAEASPRSVSVSLSLLHLIGPLVEGTFELRLADHVGLGGVLGRGQFPLEGERYTVWEYGVQLNVYSSAFEGLMVSAEALRFSGEGEPEQGVRGTGVGSLLSGLLGYKGISSAGVTVVLQAGVTRVLAEATAENSQGSRSEETSLWLPTANVNLGFSL